MLEDHATYRALRAILTIIIDVSFFWQRRLWAWWTSKPAKTAFNETLTEANLFEEWEAAAFQLDALNGNDLWRQNPTSKYYDYRLIYERLQAIIDAREEEDILGLVNLLRSGLVRNLGNITAPRLYNRAYAGTKLLIEDYITQVALAIEDVAAYPTSPAYDSGLTNQAKLDLLHDTRQAFGRSALVLQGGAIFGLCHIGVVKALHLRGLLPRIIVGTATGALIAALVGVHTEDELQDFLTAERIDLTAFTLRKKRRSGAYQEQVESPGWFATLLRRMQRFIKEGYFLDATVLEECVKANVGDLTFEEAYTRTRRVLNIMIPAEVGSGAPNLLNYLTAPNVLIRSAAVASNAATPTPSHPLTLLCKSRNNKITPWSATTTTTTTLAITTATPSIKPSRSRPGPPPASYPPHQPDLRDSPLTRVAELFNVNHFLVSQARPYIAPFLQTGDSPPHTHSSSSATGSSTASSRPRNGTLYQPLLRLITLELQHRLRQLDALGYLPQGARRFLLDEAIPGPSLTLVPELTAADFWGLLVGRPDRKGVAEWILRGERSTWPAVGALKIRCAVEVQLDRAYQEVRRKKPMDVVMLDGKRMNGEAAAGMGNGGPPHGLKGTGEKIRKRVRANSVGVSGPRT